MRTRRSQSSSDPVSLPGPSTGLRAKHRSVLLHEVLEQLSVAPGDTVVDATLGGAGHAKALAEQLGTEGTFIGFDLDADALERAKNALADVRPAVHLVQANFRDLARELPKFGIRTITKALFDLGWSSYQLDSGRGFSFLKDEPLRMTYAKGEAGLTAERIVNEWGEESLADILFGWGEERYARRIAKAIVATRAKKPFRTSRELAETVFLAVPPAYRHGRLHPATRTFQALRIAVNDELGSLNEGLRAAWSMLGSEGRIAVISFHSIEDRLVKRLFKEWEESDAGERITRKPLSPTDAETRANPRARSAKLRVIRKVKDIFHESSHSKDKQIRPLDLPGED